MAKGEDQGNGTQPGSYEVGYGKPPRHSRFKKGQSGNPSGRQKGSRGVKTILAREMNAPFTTRINGEPTSGTKQELMYRTLMTRAAIGDIKAAAILIPLLAQTFGLEDLGNAGMRLSAQDQTLLEAVLAGRTFLDPAEMSRPEGEEGEEAVGHA